MREQTKHAILEPHKLHEHPLHTERVTVWCAISRIGIIGPWFFEENERAVTVNCERYVSMIEVFFLPKLEEMNAGEVWFQQDGTTAHTARRSINLLREHFPERLISLKGDLQWPARSPDLAPCDFSFGATLNLWCTRIVQKPSVI